MKNAVASESAKAMPPLAVAAWTMNDWLIMASIAYVCLQAAYLIWKWRRDAKA